MPRVVPEQALVGADQQYLNLAAQILAARGQRGQVPALPSPAEEEGAKGLMAQLGGAVSVGVRAGQGLLEQFWAMPPDERSVLVVAARAPGALGVTHWVLGRGTQRLDADEVQVAVQKRLRLQLSNQLTLDNDPLFGPVLGPGQGAVVSPFDQIRAVDVMQQRPMKRNTTIQVSVSGVGSAEIEIGALWQIVNPVGYVQAGINPEDLARQWVDLAVMSAFQSGLLGVLDQIRQQGEQSKTVITGALENTVAKAVTAFFYATGPLVYSSARQGTVTVDVDWPQVEVLTKANMEAAALTAQANGQRALRQAQLQPVIEGAKEVVATFGDQLFKLALALKEGSGYQDKRRRATVRRRRDK